MRIHFNSIAVGGVITLALLGGCGKDSRFDGTGKPIGKSAGAESVTNLPDWASKNPSPEFLRAAKMLKPMPGEMLAGAAQKGEYSEALLTAFQHTWLASYEFFGTLDDGQMETFRSTKRISIPVKSLTNKQRRALDYWFEVWRTSMAGQNLLGAEDYLILLYKNNAKKDLSNVEVGFDVPKGAPVHLRFRITQPDGKVEQLGLTFALF
jgi:hypothetical protein